MQLAREGLVFLLVALLGLVWSQSVNIVQSSASGDRWVKQNPTSFVDDFYSDNLITVDPRQQFQKILGFGGAFTEAAGFVFSQMSAANQEKILEAYFNPTTGLNYTLGRVHMNSCDFSINSYSCDDVKDDFNLVNFNIERDKRFILPLLKGALNKTKTYNPKKDMKIYVSPWSPPAWMKTNGKMVGSNTPCMPDDDRYHRTWALWFSKFMTAYQQELPLLTSGFWGLTIQNEPEFAAPWEACSQTPEFQRDFVKKYLGPQMEKDFPKVKIMIFDHNRDHVYKWAKTVFSDPLAAKYVSGVAYHWYSEGYYENLQLSHDMYPDKFLLSTESTNCPGVLLNDWDRARAYASDIIQGLNRFSIGWVDWNLVLDMKGGPNHLNNFCDSPIIADAAAQQVYFQPMYYILGHFSKYVPTDSVRIHQANDFGVESIAFLVSDQVVLIVHNPTKQAYDFKVRDAKLGLSFKTSIPALAIRTFTYPIA